MPNGYRDRGQHSDGYWYHFNASDSDNMRQLCSTEIEVTPMAEGLKYHYQCRYGWHWHRDWLEIIDEDAEIAEIYALLLIESGEI